MKQADFSNMFREASKCVCILTIVVFPEPLFPTPSTSSATRTPENAQEDPDYPDQQIRRYPNVILLLYVAQQ